MVKPSPITHCKRGHPFNAKNTAFWCDNRGRIHRRCRRCHAAYNSAANLLRYRHDDAYRKARCATANAYHHAKRCRPNASV